jgi:hypothetical protein
MTTRNLIDLPDHPHYAGVTRKADVFGCHNKYRQNMANLEIEVFHFKEIDGEEVPQKKLDGIVYLRADNDDKVNKNNGDDLELVLVDDETKPINDQNGLTPEDPYWTETYEQKSVYVKKGTDEQVAEADVMGEYDYLYAIVNIQKAHTQVELEDIYCLLKVDKINEHLYE